MIPRFFLKFVNCKTNLFVGHLFHMAYRQVLRANHVFHKIHKFVAAQSSHMLNFMVILRLLRASDRPWMSLEHFKCQWLSVKPCIAALQPVSHKIGSVGVEAVGHEVERLDTDDIVQRPLAPRHGAVAIWTQVRPSNALEVLLLQGW